MTREKEERKKNEAEIFSQHRGNEDNIFENFVFELKGETENKKTDHNKVVVTVLEEFYQQKRIIKPKGQGLFFIFTREKITGVNKEDKIEDFDGVEIVNNSVWIEDDHEKSIEEEHGRTVSVRTVDPMTEINPNVLRGKLIGSDLIGILVKDKNHPAGIDVGENVF